MSARITLSLLVLLSVGVAQDAARVLEVKRPDRSRAFYGHLGFMPGESDADVLTRDDVVLRLERGKPGPDELEHAVLVVVDRLRPLEKELRKNGVKLTEQDGPGRAKWLLTHDPDGRRIVIRTARAAQRPPVPALGELNPIVLEVMERYPTDGTHRYHWPRGGSWRGCTKDLTYGGEVVSAGDEEGRAYCCGLTFEVFLDAWKIWCRRNGWPERIADFDVAGVRRLQSQWFGSASDRTCIRTALVENDLGRHLKRLDDAEPGDFVQLWRNNGSGHSVIFLEWEKKRGRIVGMTYWSTQKSTRGIGRRTERFGSGKRDMKRDEIYVCRVGTR